MKVISPEQVKIAKDLRNKDRPRALWLILEIHRRNLEILSGLWHLEKEDLPTGNWDNQERTGMSEVMRRLHAEDLEAAISDHSKSGEEAKLRVVLRA